MNKFLNILKNEADVLSDAAADSTNEVDTLGNKDN